ncbi:Uncharacterised protein [uncultured archaeon]|nr:Uncharacterised protein [uncultured archaeon]
MAGEEVFTSNALVSFGTAFFFLALYIFSDTKGLKGLFKPVFFIIALVAIINAWHGQYLAYKVTGLADDASYIMNFWMVALPWLLYGLLAAALIDLAFMAVQAVFYPEGKSDGSS